MYIIDINKTSSDSVLIEINFSFLFPISNWFCDNIYIKNTLKQESPSLTHVLLFSPEKCSPHTTLHHILIARQT